MDMYKKIVVAVDGSEVSKNAFRHAVELTRQNNGALTVIHIVPQIETLDIETFKPESLRKGMMQEGEKILSEVRELAGKSGITVQASVEEGVPFEKICEVADKSDADLIVMGSHGRSGIGKVLIGSVTERVISRTSCPVLVVK